MNLNTLSPVQAHAPLHQYTSSRCSPPRRGPRSCWQTEGRSGGPATPSTLSSPSSPSFPSPLPHPSLEHPQTGISPCCHPVTPALTVSGLGAPVTLTSSHPTPQTWLSHTHRKHKLLVRSRRISSAIQEVASFALGSPTAPFPGRLPRRCSLGDLDFRWCRRVLGSYWRWAPHRSPVSTCAAARRRCTLNRFPAGRLLCFSGGWRVFQARAQTEADYPD